MVELKFVTDAGTGGGDTEADAIDRSKVDVFQFAAHEQVRCDPNIEANAGIDTIDERGLCGRLRCGTECQRAKRLKRGRFRIGIVGCRVGNCC